MLQYLNMKYPNAAINSILPIIIGSNISRRKNNSMVDGIGGRGGGGGGGGVGGVGGGIIFVHTTLFS